MSEHQDSPKVPWPKVVRAVGDPSYPNEGIALYKDGLPRGIEESEDLEVRTYIPVSALLSDEVVEAAAREITPTVAGLRNPEIHLKLVRFGLQAAIEQVGGGQGAE